MLGSFEDSRSGDHGLVVYRHRVAKRARRQGPGGFQSYLHSWRASSQGYVRLDVKALPPGCNHLRARQRGESKQVTDSPKECQEDVAFRLWRKRRREDVTEEYSCRNVAPIESTDATASAGSESRLASIDMTTGALTDVHAGPGVKVNPWPLSGNDVGYIRKDSAEAGIYYTSGSRGPRGAIRAAAWSPDGKRVVFHRRSTPTLAPLVKMYSRNPNYELNLSGAPAGVQPIGQTIPDHGQSPGANVAALKVNTPETGQSEVLYQDKTRNAFVGGWSPRGDKVVFAWEALRRSSTDFIPNS